MRAPEVLGSLVVIARQTESLNDAETLQHNERAVWLEKCEAFESLGRGEIGWERNAEDERFDR